MAVAKLGEHVPLLLLLIIIQTWTIALLGVLPIISCGYNYFPLRCCGEMTQMRERHMQWMQTHNKTYKDPAEHEHRCCVYQTNVHFIQRFNSHDFSFNLTDNCFADLTNEEFLQTYRCLGGTFLHVSFIYIYIYHLFTLFFFLPPLNHILFINHLILCYSYIFNYLIKF